MAFSAARLLFVVAAGLSVSPLHAQISAQPVPPPVQTEAPQLNMEELSQLLAPIALYPDALVALILPASTVPSDVVLSARFLKANGDPAKADNQPWDESVKSLARYPDVLTWLDENLEWTASVGEAFVEQPADVMNAIQALRNQARAAGNLVDTPEQKVIVEEKIIRIVPADPQVIYVPQYDPQIVYVESYSSVPVLTFGLGFAVGSWLSYDFDWNRRSFYRGNWRGWNHDWNRSRDRDYDRNGNRGDVNVVNIDIVNANQWQPTPNARRQINQRQRNNNGNARFVSTRTARTAQPTARQNSNPQNGIYNPVSNPALPRPTQLERVTRENTRGPAPGRNGTPVADPVQVGTLPPSPEERPNRREGSRTQAPERQNVVPTSPTPPTDPGNPGATPGRSSRTRPVPSSPPDVPGQLKTPGQPRDGKKEPRQSKQPDRFAPETATAIREEKPSAFQPPTTPRPNRVNAPNPARNNGNPTTVTPTAPPPQVTIPNSPGKSRNNESSAQPKQPDRAAPVTPNVPKQEKRSVPRQQQVSPPQNSRSEPVAPQPPRVKAPQAVQQPAPVTRSQPPPQASEPGPKQRPHQAQKSQQAPPQQPPPKRAAPDPKPQAPSVQQAPTLQRPAPAPKPQAPTQQRPAPAPKPQAQPPQQQATPQGAPAQPVPAAPPGADRDRKRKD